VGKRAKHSLSEPLGLIDLSLDHFDQSRSSEYNNHGNNYTCTNDCLINHVTSTYLSI